MNTNRKSRISALPRRTLQQITEQSNFARFSINISFRPQRLRPFFPRQHWCKVKKVNFLTYQKLLWFFLFFPIPILVRKTNKLNARSVLYSPFIFRYLHVLNIFPFNFAQFSFHRSLFLARDELISNLRIHIPIISRFKKLLVVCL